MNSDSWDPDTARKILDFSEKAGMQVHTPKPGERVNLVVFRVEDERLLGTAVPGFLVRRRVPCTCSRCGHDCFMDPNSYEPGIPVPICIRCLDDKISEELDKEIAKAAAARSVFGPVQQDRTGGETEHGT